jgi:RND family efflux transporter MFP subunit
LEFIGGHRRIAPNESRDPDLTLPGTVWCPVCARCVLGAICVPSSNATVHGEERFVASRTVWIGLVLVFSVAAIGCRPRDGSTVAAAVPSELALEPTSKTIFGGRVLLYLEYPHLVRGETARFLAHLSVLETGEPIRAGRVAIEVGATKLSVDAPKREGLFTPEGAVATSGRFPGRLTVSSEQAEESLDLGEFVVHATTDDARKAAEAAKSDDPVGTVPFLMEQQWKVKLLLAVARQQSLTRRLIVPAQARLPEGAEAVIAAPMAGRLSGPTSGHLPISGEQVEPGQVLGFVEPPLAAPDLAQLQALSLEFDLKALDVARSVSETKAKLEFAQRERERVAKLRERGLSTQQQFDEAERNLSLAQSDEASARATKESLDRLVESRRRGGGDASSPATRFPLVAPLKGVVISSGHVQGVSVDPTDTLFRVLDTSRIWVEGRVSEFDLPLVRSASTATATFSALPGARFDAAPGVSDGSFFLAPVVDPSSRTVAIRCEVANPERAIRSGMLAELALAVAKSDAAVVIPTDAIVMDQGTPTAYVMLEGEKFQKRELELGIKDVDLVEVRRGIASGERVATRGAYVVKLAALSPASFGPGHQH